MNNENPKMQKQLQQDYPVYTVVALDLGVNETCIVLDDEHWNIIEVFHTDSTEEAFLKHEEFSASYPKAIITNNAIIATHFYQYKIEELKQELGLAKEGG